MKDRARLAITGAIALAALAATVGGRGLNFDFNFGDDKISGERGKDGGNRATRTLAGLKDFQGVELAGPDDVVIKHGETFAVQAEGSRDALDRLDIKVRNGTLAIGRKTADNWLGGDHEGGAVIHVTLPALRHVALTGPGDMAVDRLEGKRVKAELTGPGDLAIAALNADRADLSVTGSGDLTVAGRAREASLNATGSGNVRARDFQTGRTSLTVIGSGDITVHASQGADISILGSGNAQVVGTTACKISKMGSGDAQCRAG